MNYFKNAKFFRCMALALLALTCFVGSNSVNAADGYALGLDCYRFQH